MSIETGVVWNVWVVPVGSDLTSDAASGATVLSVEDATDFGEDGGWLTIGEETLQYESADKDAETLTLVSPTAAAHSEGDRVSEAPYSEQKFAEVQLDGQDRAIEVEVDEKLWRALPEGTRDLDTAEWVEINEPHPDTFVVSRILGGAPSEVYELDGGDYNLGDAIADGSISQPTTDGLPPAEAPSGVEVVELIRQAIIRHTGVENADPVTYRYHVATTNAAPPSAVTKHHDHIATRTAVESLPDGTPLAPDTTYYAAVEARDDDVDEAEMGPFSAWVPFQVILVQGVDIQPGSITATEISDDSITTPKLTAEAVTADKIAANSITSDQIAANSILADSLAAKAITSAKLDALLVIAGQLLTAESGRRAEVSNAGFFLYEQDGTPLLEFNTDGTGFIMNADVVARTLSALSGVSLLGTSRLARGGVFILESETKASTSPPTAVPTWPINTITYQDDPASRRGLHWDSATSGWWFCSKETPESDWQVTHLDANGDYVEKFIIGEGGTLNPEGGLTKVGSSWFVLAYETGSTEYKVYEYDAAFDRQDDGFAIPGGDGYRPGIGTDGTEILVVQAVPINSVDIYRYSTAGSPLGTLETTAPGDRDYYTVMKGSFDFGGSRYVLSRPRSVSNDLAVNVIHPTTGIDTTGEAWPLANGANVAGVAWDGSNFWHLSASGHHLAKYLGDGNYWTGLESSTWRACFTYTDGTNETYRSPFAVVTMKKRARLLVTAPEIPNDGIAGDPDSIRVWLNRGSSDTPGDSSVFLNASPSAGDIMVQIDDAEFSVGTLLSGRRPDFTDSNPAEIRTADGVTLIRANGAPRLRLTKGNVSVSHGGTGTTMGWDAADVDTDEMWSAGSPSVFQPAFTGQWTVSCRANWAANGSNRRGLWVEQSTDGGSNWTTYQNLQDHRLAVAATEITTTQFSMMVTLHSDRLYRVMRYQNSGAALDIGSASLTLKFEGPE